MKPCKKSVSAEFVHPSSSLEYDLVVALRDDRLPALHDGRGGGRPVPGHGLACRRPRPRPRTGGGRPRRVEQLEDVVERDRPLLGVGEVDLDLHLELTPAGLADLVGRLRYYPVDSLYSFVESHKFSLNIC